MDIKPLLQKRKPFAMAISNEMIQGALAIIVLGMFFTVGDSFFTTAGEANTTYYFVKGIYWTLVKLIPVGLLIYMAYSFYTGKKGK